jgi:DNA-binding NarL/FixJ family response regulator
VIRVQVLAHDSALRVTLARQPGLVIVDADPDVLVIDTDGRGVAALPPPGGPPAVALLDIDIGGTAALRAGARAVLPRESGADEIAAAIQAVAAGLLVLHPDLAGAIDPSTAPTSAPSAATAGAPLTPRERQVLTLLADGLGNKTIAGRLGISDHTVKAHVAAIFEKLSVSTRAEAAAVGLRRGFIAL